MYLILFQVCSLYVVGFYYYYFVLFFCSFLFSSIFQRNKMDVIDIRKCIVYWKERETKANHQFIHIWNRKWKWLMTYRCLEVHLKWHQKVASLVIVIAVRSLYVYVYCIVCFVCCVYFSSFSIPFFFSRFFLFFSTWNQHQA